ncbi:hypothetical protein, partial [Frankia sp. AgB32]|uniref:hypothetical protein n=1 Tax=Frankia sp. AgB32 TaxID=631119 RepID=UPI00200EC31D
RHAVPTHRPGVGDQPPKIDLSFTALRLEVLLLRLSERDRRLALGAEARSWPSLRKSPKFRISVSPNAENVRFPKISTFAFASQGLADHVRAPHDFTVRLLVVIELIESAKVA